MTKMETYLVVYTIPGSEWKTVFQTDASSKEEASEICIYRNPKRVVLKVQSLSEEKGEYNEFESNERSVSPVFQESSD